MKIKALIVLAISLLVFACKKDNNEVEMSNCNTSVILDSNLYNTANDSNFTIENALISGDCLYVEYYSSGCSGDTWEMSLYDAERIIASFPPSRIIRLSLINTELCQAVFKKVISFDLTDLQINDTDEMGLNLSQGYTFTYQY
ncbi:MAG: hypothetical protein ACI8P7_001081 [Candidatus Azotimanducaceae bacterium]|jgi:hypothetical protein